MYFLIHHFSVQDLEGIEVDALIEGENSVADGGVVGQAEVFLRGARGRGWMRMPVGENLQAILTDIL